MVKILQKHKTEIIFFVIYLLFGILFTWPVILHFNSYIYGGAGDSFYNLWTFRNISGHILEVNMPVGLEHVGNILVPPYPVLELLGKTFTYLFHSWIASYNFIVLISFPLAGMAVYLIAKEMTGNKLAAFFAGLVFAISPFHLARAGAHINLVSIYWMALFLLVGLRALKNPKISTWILLGFVGGITLLDHYQFGIAAFLSFVLLVVFWIISKKGLSFIKFIPYSIIPFIIVIMLLAPWLVSGDLNKNNRGFGFFELKVYSARVLNYVLPLPSNPILGKYTEDIYAKSLQKSGSNIVEQTLYLGWIPIILALIAIISLFNRDEKKNRFFVAYLVTLGLLGYYFSFAPTINIFGHDFRTPSYYIFTHFNYFRVYARFGLMVLLAVSLLSGIGLSYLQERLNQKKFSWIFLILCCLLLVEFINFPPFKHVDVSENAMPEAYKWLEKQPKGLVAEYPLLPTDEPTSYDYLLWQIYHKMPLVYGAPIHSESDNFRKEIINPEKEQTVTELKKISVKYVVVHRDMYIKDNANKYPQEYNFGSVPKLNNTNFELVYEDNNDLVYLLK